MKIKVDQGMKKTPEFPEITRNKERKAGKASLLSDTRRNQSCQHLDLSLQPSGISETVVTHAVSATLSWQSWEAKEWQKCPTWPFEIIEESMSALARRVGNPTHSNFPRSVSNATKPSLVNRLIQHIQ